jgi:hypothetical protein
MLTYDDPLEKQDASPGFEQGLRSLLYAAAAPVVLLVQWTGVRATLGGFLAYGLVVGCLVLIVVLVWRLLAPLE